MDGQERRCRERRQVTLHSEPPVEHRHRTGLLLQLLNNLANIFNNSILRELTPIVEQLFYSFFSLEEDSVAGLCGRLMEIEVLRTAALEEIFVGRLAELLRGYIRSEILQSMRQTPPVPVQMVCWPER